MSWYLAPALDTLRRQINATYPGRSKVSDGTIGDAAHSSRFSDHNPDASGMVCAIDITHDPAHGVDIAALADRLKAAADPRIKYLICNARITSPNGLRGSNWTRYTGANAHRKHVHISVYGGALGRNASSFAGIGTPLTGPSHSGGPATSTGGFFMALSDYDQQYLLNAVKGIEQRLMVPGYPFDHLPAIHAKVDQANASLAVLLGRDPAEVDAAAVAKAIPDELAKQVAEELAKRLAA